MIAWHRAGCPLVMRCPAIEPGQRRVGAALVDEDELRWGVWVGATALGACIAWTLGMIPSTVMTTGTESGTSAAPGQMSDLVIYALAAGLGLVTGSILGAPQWLALRPHLPKAGWWVLANALAWAVGMVVIFIGTSFIPASGMTWSLALLLLFFVAAAGTLVGAIHGLFLIWMLQQREQAEKRP